MKMNKKGNFDYGKLISGIIMITLIILGYLIVDSSEKKTVKDKATELVQKCENRNYTICQYYYIGGYDREEFINEVEKQGWKLKTVAGKYADYLYFEKDENDK